MNAPLGEVALVITDIERSTPLWEHAQPAMAVAMDLHDRLLRELAEASAGYVFRHEGDALLVAFASPAAAVRFALAAQEALHAAPWPAALLARPEAADTPTLRGLRVRIGVHRGAPHCQRDPVTGRMDYRGAVTHCASATARAARGGQVLATDAAWQAALAEWGAQPQPETQDLGRLRLPGLDSEAHLWELCPLGLPRRRFPRPQVQEAVPRRLPTPASRFFGREEDLASLAALLDPGEGWVTVTGPGGMGKSRLLLQHGVAAAGSAGGVWYADLAGAEDGFRVLITVGEALGSPIAAGRSPAQGAAQIGRALAARRDPLLLLDNAEGVVFPLAELLTSWRRAAPLARFLVSSRERLARPEERVLELGPLEEEPSIALFQDRARAVRQEFTVAPGDRALVAEIAAALDGIPLAIELAAARAAVMPLRALRERLSKRFQLLRGNRAWAGARAATLSEAIAGSWESLDDPEQAAMMRVAVFRGGFDLAAAAEVLADLALPPTRLQALLTSLRDKSLIRASAEEGPTRYTLYESVRAFAEAELSAAGGRAEAERRHRDSTLGRAEQLARDSAGAKGGEALAALVMETDNLLAVHRRAMASPPDPDAAVRSLAALVPVFSTRGVAPSLLPAFDDLLWVSASSPPRLQATARLARSAARRAAAQREGALEDAQAAARLTRGREDLELHLEARLSCARIARELGDLPGAEAELEAALDQARAAGRRDALGGLLATLGLVYMETGRSCASEAAMREALLLFRAEGLYRPMATQQGNLAAFLMEAGRLTEAVQSAASALAAQRELGSTRHEASMLGLLGQLSLDLGDLPRAESQLRAAERLVFDAGFFGEAALILGALGTTLHEQGREAEAEATLREAIDRAQTARSRVAEALALANLGVLLLSAGRLDEADDALRAAAAHFGEIQYRRPLAYAQAFRGALAAIRGQVEAADAALREAAADLSAVSDPLGLAMIGCLEGLVQLARRQRSLAAGDPAGAEAAEAEARAALRRSRLPVAPSAPTSHDLRAASALLNAAIARLEASP